MVSSGQQISEAGDPTWSSQASNAEKTPRGKRETSVALLGVAIDNITMDEFLQSVDEMIAEGGFHQVATANADFLMKSVADDELHEALCRCDYVLPDGMPLVWASRMLGNHLKERVAGADLVPKLAQLSQERGYRLYLLGASEESSVGTAAWMEKNYPGARIVGRYCPELQPLEAMDHEDILSRIEAAEPDILLVAFGNPKQEKWLAMHRRRLNVPVCIGVGGSFDFLSGRIPRAPFWMQRCGLEWLYRTIQEPGRLGKRYAGNAAALLRYVPRQIAVSALQAKSRVPGTITKTLEPSAAILRVRGSFTGALVKRFLEEVEEPLASYSHIIVDLSGATYLGADAIGCLLHVMKATSRRRRELWLTGVRWLQLRVLRAAKLGTFFRRAPKPSDALRRIEPDFAAGGASGTEWLSLQVGGKVIPVHSREIPALYYQAKEMLRDRNLHGTIAGPSSPKAKAVDILTEELI